MQLSKMLELMLYKNISKDSKFLNDLPKNLKKAGKICHDHNIGKIFVLEITPSIQINTDIFNINIKYVNCV